MSDVVIIPQEYAKVGDIIKFGGKNYIAEQHFSQGKEMVGKGYTHIMYASNGAFGMVEVD